MSEMLVNFWVGLRDDTPIDDSETDEQGNVTYTNPTRRRLIDPGVRRQFKQESVGPRKFTLHSLYYRIDAGDDDVFQGRELGAIRDTVTSDFGTNSVRILGAWNTATGEQIKNPGGQPVININQNILLKYMPDVVTYDEDGNETSRTDATTISDVNLLFGQKPRDFS